MRPSKGSAHVLELIFGFLMLVILLMGMFWVLWLGGGRIDRARIADKWKKFVKRFIPCFTANGNRSAKGVIVAVEQDGVENGNDVEAGKAFKDEGEEEGGGGGGEEEEDQLMSSVLIGLQSRLLFTIMEESKEDLGSECGRSSRGEQSKRLSITKSWSDLGSRSSRRLQSESGPFTPPSKFKFLREADDEFCRRMKLETEEIALSIRPSSQLFPPVKDGLWSKIVGRRKENDILPQVIQSPSASSRVLPLESSPPY